MSNFDEQILVNSSDSKKRNKRKCELYHLVLTDSKLKQINKLSSHRQLRSVYLNNNSIERIQNLDSFCRLTHLYLQRNCISKIEGLSQLTSLRRLYLGFNRISRLENIYGLDSLHELHLEQQEFSGDFSFEEKSLDSLSKCLKVLNISGLKLRTFECVKSLENLEHLIADGNEFQRSEDIADYITTLQLHQLDVNDCPAQKIDAHFSRKIIVASSSLEILNGKTIHKNTKAFMNHLELMRLKRLAKQNNRPTIQLNLSQNDEDKDLFGTIVAEATADLNK